MLFLICSSLSIDCAADYDQDRIVCASAALALSKLSERMAAKDEAASNAPEFKLEDDADVELDAQSLPPPSEVVPAAARKVGKRRKERKGFITCPGCDEAHPASCFEMNQRFEVNCKKKLDRIYVQAKAQGETKWFSEQKKDDKKVKQMLKHYSGIVASTEDVKKQKFVVATYTELFKTEQCVQYRGRGCMMWERQAIEHWLSTAGGSMSADDAQAKWDEWAAHYKELDILHDFLSPNPKKPLRLRIPTTDDVDFVNQATKIKQIEASEQAVKKPKAEDVDKMRARTLTGFDKIGNGSASIDNQNIARSMIGGGAGTAFDHVGMSLPDITCLGGNECPTEDDDAVEEKTSDAVTSAASASAGASPSGKRAGEPLEGTPDGKKKKKWFDLAGSINVARRNLRSSLQVVKTGMGEAISKLKVEMQEIKQLPEAQAKSFAGELAVADVRMKGCEYVLEGSEQELEAYIHSFDEPADAAAGSVAAGAGPRS
jgi:hypothetical protein